MIYELQYFDDELIDVRHILEGDKQGVPRGPKGEPKPWGSGETAGRFRIERHNLTREQGEKFRKASVAHAGGEPNADVTNDDELINYIVTKKDPYFRARLKERL